jgi:preprotein translocase subunit YajC
MLDHILFAANILYAAAPSQQTAEGGAPAAGGGGGPQLIIFIVGFILIFYFLMLRPQKKQQKERQHMLDSIKSGDRVQTNGGLLGIVTAVDDRELTVRIAPEVRVKIARSAIAWVVKAQEQRPAQSQSKEPKESKGDADLDKDS